MELPFRTLISVWVNHHSGPTPESSILCVSSALLSFEAWRGDSAARTPGLERLELTKDGGLSADTTGPRSNTSLVYQSTLPLSR